jgi:hypothetical protein
MSVASEISLQMVKQNGLLGVRLSFSHIICPENGGGGF